MMLTNIAKRYHDCDKDTYTEFYDTYFGKLKNLNRKIIIFEIGIAYGDSLRIWNEYFNGNCEIYAIDIREDFVNNEELLKFDNIHTYQCDQSNIDEVKKIFNSIGKQIDIIIDDGSHVWKDQISCMINLYKYLSDDGFYICEDLGTSFTDFVQTDFFNKENYSLIDSPLSFIIFKHLVPYENINQQLEFINMMKESIIYSKHPSYSITSIITFFK